MRRVRHLYASGADVASYAYYALYSLQHRGQESAGIVVNDDGLFRSLRDTGLVSEVFPPEQLKSLGKYHRRRPCALRHDRQRQQAQRPAHFSEPLQGPYGARAQRQPDDSRELRQELESRGSIFQTTTDSEVIAYIIVQERLNRGSIEEAVSAAMDRIEGAYSLVLSSPTKLIAARDPHGFRPLCMGHLKDGSVVFASESCALDAIGAEFERDIRPGEIVVVDTAGVRSDTSHCGKAPKKLSSSSSSTSPALTPSSTAAASTSHASAQARSSRSSIPCRRMSSSACRIPALMQPSVTRARAASPTASALSK